MATQGAYKRINDGLILQFDPANIKCFRGEPTINFDRCKTSGIILDGNSQFGTVTDGFFKGRLCKKVVINSPPDLQYWSGIYCSFNPTSYGAVIGSTITRSCKIYIESIESLTWGIQMAIEGTSINRSFIQIDTNNRNEWQHVSCTGTLVDTSNNFLFYLYAKNEYSPTRISFTIYVCDFQSEVKAYSTPYTPTSRGTTVATGGGFADLSGYNNHGELINGVLYDSNNCGSLKFDGVDDYVDCGIKDNLTLSNGGTISIFFKWKSYNGSSWSNTLIGRGYGSWVGHHYILFKYSGTHRLSFSISDGTNTLSGSLMSSFDIELNKVYHVVITINNPLKQMYINGVLNSSISSSIMPISASTPLSLGRTGTAGYYLDGIIYNVSIYNRVLSPEEITQIYNSTKSRYL